MINKTFEQCYNELNNIVEKKRGDWTLKASLKLDFDDVKYKILNHIYNKWHLYDQKRPLVKWATTIVRNQFTNILRDEYSSTCSPCLNCPLHLGDKKCKLYGECSTECKKYNEWYNSKRHWHAAKLPVPLENHCSEVFSQPSSSFDVEKAALNLHKKIKKKLTVSEWAIYERLYVKNLTEDETAQQLGFETNEKGRKRGYKRIKQVKIIIIKKAKEIINEYGAEGIVHE